MEKKIEEREIFHFELKWNQDEERENENLSIIGYRLQNYPSVQKTLTVRNQDRTVRRTHFGTFGILQSGWQVSSLPMEGKKTH